MHIINVIYGWFRWSRNLNITKKETFETFFFATSIVKDNFKPASVMYFISYVHLYCRLQIFTWIISTLASCMCHFIVILILAL